MEIRLDQLLDALPIILKGYLGIFAVTAVIIVLVMLLNAVTRTKNPKE